jgi:hypothetical protein
VTVRERVERIQLRLEVVAASAAMLWGVAAAVLVIIAAAVINALLKIPGDILWLFRPASFVIGVSIAVVLIWRGRFAWALDRVALWIEERAPDLRYSVVTAADERYASTAAGASALLEKIDTGAFVRRAAVRSISPAVIWLAALLVLSSLIPARWKDSAASKGLFGNAASSGLLAGSRLAPIEARIVPPQYSRLPTEKLSEPTTLSGIRGSRVILEGPGSSRGITAELSSADGKHSPLSVGEGDGKWMVTMTMADTTPAMLDLSDRAFRRSIVINPRADTPPTVKIRLPARDTALRTASGSLELAADLADDIGLASAQFEYIISSGSEETFSFKQGILGATRFNGEKSGKLSTSVPYSIFKLGEGDRLSIRAVAADQNSLTGPGKGFSETRTIRVARKDEYDSLSVEAAAPSSDTALLSLRMVILETERLEAERKRITRDTLVARSTTLARQTDRIQDEVLPLYKEEGTDEPQVTMDTEPTERAAPVTVVLKSAVDALGEASRDLDIADTHSALPQLYKAYKALESFRTFKRYYLRGATRAVIVDIQRVRLSGKTKGTATPMSPRGVATSDRDRMRLEYSAAIEQLRSAPSTAVTMLTMIRVESLRKYPALSAAIADALGAIDRGRDVTGPLLRVRRLLEATPTVTDSIPLWSGGL